MHKNKIDLTFVPWRRDRITRHYVERNGATLEVPTRMTGDFDTTRFDGIRSLFFNKALIEQNHLDNPYALELTVRAGTSRKFAEAEPDEKYAILVQAAQKFGIQLF